ncbi:MAG: peptidylprolyl isomerase [Firmicutes bacterium]|nr:peptidylprolyl isomerase [[Eubacterium] siraeum]MCM1487168.1 peptidylprolyl isomerase [Bacillota bacterium]
MKKTVKNTGAIALALSVALLSGCTQNQTDGEDNASDTDSGASSAAADDYTKVEVETPDSFKGNTAEVVLEKGDAYAVIKIKDYGEIKCKLFPEAAPKGVQNFIETAESGFYTNKIMHRIIKDFMIQGGSKNGDGMSSPDEAAFGVEYNKNMRHFYGALCYANAGGVNGTQFYIVNKKTCDLTAAGTIADYEEALKTLASYIEQCTDLIGSTTGDEKEYYTQALEYYKSQQETCEYAKHVLEQRTEEMEAKYNKVGGVPFLDGDYTVFGQVVEGFEVLDKISEAEVEMNSSGEESSPVTEIVIESVTVGTVE